MATLTTTMSRSQLRFIADIIANMPASKDERKAWALQFADKLADTNPRFNRAKFVDAATNNRE